MKQNEFKNGFEKISCLTEDHTTPFNTTQNFLFCSFKKQQNKACIFTLRKKTIHLLSKSAFLNENYQNNLKTRFD